MDTSNIRHFLQEIGIYFTLDSVLHFHLKFLWSLLFYFLASLMDFSVPWKCRDCKFVAVSSLYLSLWLTCFPVAKMFKRERDRDRILNHWNSEGGCVAFVFFIKLRHEVILSIFINCFLQKALLIIHITQITLKHIIAELIFSNIHSFLVPLLNVTDWTTPYVIQNPIIILRIYY